ETALLVAVPALFLKTARYRFPFCSGFAAVIVSVVDVAPSIGVNVPPPFVDTSHCSVGAGVPVAIDSKTAFSPSLTFLGAGCFETFGGTVFSKAGSVELAPRDALAPSTRASARGASRETASAAIRSTPARSAARHRLTPARPTPLEVPLALTRYAPPYPSIRRRFSRPPGVLLLRGTNVAVAAGKGA